MLSDLRHHLIFLGTFALGVILALLSYRLSWPDRLLIGADTFFLSYLIAAFARGNSLQTAGWRRRGNDEDEGMALIVLLALVAVVISVIAIALALNAPSDHAGVGQLGAGQAGSIGPALALVSVPLGWAMIHTVLAFHYAALWYAQTDDGQDAGGLDFPGGTTEPQFWDFIYYSFTLGMTAQTSDVGVKTTHLRRITILHGALSFFYNTVILALAVNAAVSLGQ